MPDPILEENARAYAELFDLRVDFERPLGYGNDGTVWKTGHRTALKAVDRKRKYDLELACYQRFADEGISAIDQFAVPVLIANNDDLMIIEMSLVSPPYIIDFAKVWLDKAPDFPDDSMQARIAQAEEDFGDDWPVVRDLLWTLKVRFGIHYTDPNLGNIKLRSDDAWPQRS